MKHKMVLLLFLTMSRRHCLISVSFSVIATPPPVPAPGRQCLSGRGEDYQAQYLLQNREIPVSTGVLNLPTDTLALLKTIPASKGNISIIQYP